MMRALFTAASGMIIQERRQTNVSNHLANAATTAFKVQELITKETDKSMIQNREATSNGRYMRDIGQLSLGAEVDELHIDFEQGVLEDTNRETDLALQGDGFFKIQWSDTTNGYTRNGHFTIDKNGYLSTEDGKRVLGINLKTNKQEPILVENKKLQVNTDGRVALDGKDTYKFEIVNLTPVSELDVIGTGAYLIKEGMEVVSTDAVIYQNKLEKSNVNPLEEMVKMIEISRTFESNQKVIQSVDEMMGKSVNEIGRIR